MQENMLDKILLMIAKATCKSTSCIGLYKPKNPKQLLKETQKEN